MGKENISKEIEKVKEAYEPLSEAYVKNPPGFVTGIMMATYGYPIGILLGIITPILFWLLPSSLSWIGITILAIALICFIVAFIGTKKFTFLGRYKKYLRILGSRDYCSVDEFVSKMGENKDKTIKYLSKMIDKNLFLHGHFNEQNTLFMLTDEVYEQYIEKIKENAPVRIEESKTQEPLPTECKNILEDGKQYIQFIHFCNDELPGEEISNKLDTLELIITRIFKEVEEKPELAGDIRRFMNYYLPTTKKLLKAYCGIEKEPILSPEMKKTKSEIESSLDTINQAFENILDDLFVNKAMDISSDISVLHTMFKQEGLTNKDFKSVHQEG